MGVVTLHQQYIYRGFLQIATLDLTRSNYPVLWLILWDPSEPIATRPLALQKNGTWYTYAHDLTKNVTEVYKTDGTIATAYDYAPFGAVTAAGIDQPIQWSSEFYDAELGMVYYNFRHYNPLDGRWISRDPLGEKGKLNVYGFVMNSLAIDYLGMNQVKDFLTMVGQYLVSAFSLSDWRFHIPYVHPLQPDNYEMDLDNPFYSDIKDKIFEHVYAQILDSLKLSAQLQIYKQCKKNRCLSGCINIERNLDPDQRFLDKLYSVIRANLTDVIFPIGNTTIVINAEGRLCFECKQYSGSFSGTLYMRLIDKYIQPFNSAVELGNPYPISANWHKEINILM